MPIVVAREVENADGRKGIRHYYWCPGCNTLHGIAIRPHTQDNDAGWTFTGTLDCPTYEPSQKSEWEGPTGKRICHTKIKKGQIEFLADCTHALKGQTVVMMPLPEWALADQRPSEPSRA